MSPCILPFTFFYIFNSYFQQMRSATDTSVSDIDHAIKRKVSGHEAGRSWKGYLK